MFRQGGGQCNDSCLGNLVKQQPINCFWKIRVVLRTTYKFYSSEPQAFLPVLVLLVLFGLAI